MSDTPVFDRTDVWVSHKEGSPGLSFDVDFDARVVEPKSYNDSSLSNAVSEVILGLQNGDVPPDQLNLLRSSIPPLTPEEEKEGAGYSAQFDLAREITSQLQICKALKSEVFHVNGSLRSGYELKDAKYVLSTVDRMIGTLMRQHEKLVNFARVQKIEQAVTDAISELPDEAKETFIRLLEEKLSS